MLHLVLTAAAMCISTPPPPVRVLFIGNSFTYVNDLPHQFKHVAEGLGKQVEVANSTIGGCTLFHQLPQYDNRTQMLLREDWDYIVLQDYSALPTVQKARAAYLDPAVTQFSQQKKQAKIVMYLTWGYHDGNTVPCPSSDVPACFPKGTLAQMTDPSCENSPYYQSMVGDFPCMGYSLVRGYLAAFRTGADLVSPCGVAWQVVRGVSSIGGCRSEIDKQYPTPVGIDLPLPTTGSLKNLMLYRILGGGVIDIHPNVAGQYINALTFFATLFNSSAQGAPPPLPTEADPPLTPLQLTEIQQAVDSVVLGHRSVWGL